MACFNIVSRGVTCRFQGSHGLTPLPLQYYDQRRLNIIDLEYGVHDRLHIYPLCGTFFFPWLCGIDTR